MRYVYVDEAGTGTEAAVTVVAGVIIDADNQYALVEDKLAAALSRVPEPLREGFISHAKSVWGNKKYRDLWTREDRLSFLIQLMSIPRECGLGLAFGICRSSYPFDPSRAPRPNLLTKAQWHHMIAFQFCLTRADKFLRDYCRPNEVATVVVENIPETQRFLRGVLWLSRNHPIVLPSSHLAPTVEEKTLGRPTQDGIFAVTKVRDGLHFVSKQDGPLLQIADAVAYGLRRYFSEERLGDEYLLAILGKALHKEDWAGDCSGALYAFGGSQLRFTEVTPNPIVPPS